MIDRMWRTSQSTVCERADLPHNGYREGVRSGVRPGVFIVVGREPYRVLELREKPEDLWPAQFEEAWQRIMTEWIEYEAARAAGEPRDLRIWPEGLQRPARRMPVRAEWHHRPINVVVQHAEQPKSKPKHLLTEACRDFQIIPEHYSVCRLCGELPPCRHAETEATVEKEMETTERLMAIPHGACLGCGKAISSRMKAVRYPGPNLWRPDWGNDSAVFHLRDQGSGYDCTNGSYRYSQQWEAACLNVLVPQLPEEEV